MQVHLVGATSFLKDRSEIRLGNETVDLELLNGIGENACLTAPNFLNRQEERN